jgi:dTDP-4-amino-4,6-dideoxygalactose transaminase
VVTSDKQLAEKVRMLANHGRLTKYEHFLEGVNSRLDTLQAAVLNVKLPHLDRWTQARQKWAALYNELLAGIPNIITPSVAPDRTHVYHLYVIQTPYRDHLLDYLKQQNISAGIHYPIPLHLQKAYAHLGYQAGDFPQAEKLGQRCLSLPMFPEMTKEEIHFVAAAVQEFCKSKV